MQIIRDIEAGGWRDSSAIHRSISTLVESPAVPHNTLLAQTEIIIYCHGIIFNQIDPIRLNRSLGTIAFYWACHKVWVNEIMD